MATEQMLKSAREFERKTNNAEAGMLRHRKHLIKKGGFKDEKDYWTNRNPFTGKRAKEATPRSKALKAKGEY